MKIRKAKKMSSIRCVHDKSEVFQVTDDPYPMYQTLIRCSRKGIREFGENLEKDPCDGCKMYQVSQKKIRDRRRFNKEFYRKYKFDKIIR